MTIYTKFESYTSGFVVMSVHQIVNTKNVTDIKEMFRFILYKFNIIEILIQIYIFVDSFKMKTRKFRFDTTRVKNLTL